MDDFVRTTLPLWKYRADLGMVTLRRDAVGYDVAATDGVIGSIHESSYDPSGAYLVVDTGTWIFGERRMIPAGVVERVDVEARTVFIALSKAEVEAAPDFEERHRRSREEYETYYGSHCHQTDTSQLNPRHQLGNRPCSTPRRCRR
jgi:hypothetical protein